MYFSLCACSLLFRMEFLAEFTSCTMSELKLNAETFRWVERIPPILDEHADIISRSRREAEEGLKVKCPESSMPFFMIAFFTTSCEEKGSYRSWRPTKSKWLTLKGLMISWK